MDVRALFPEREEIAAEQVEAIAAVCGRLGSEREWVADDGYEHTIVGGAVDGDRVAWVERRSSADEGWEDVDYHLRMRLGDVLVREWVVDTYNPYFGCDVGYLRWWGDEVVIVYREKHETIVCALGATGAPRLRAIEYGWQVLGDVLLYESEGRGLVERIHLPGLTRRAPLPGATAAAYMSSGACPSGPVISGSPEELVRRIAGRLPALPGALAEVLIGALAYRFWDPWPPLVATYQQAYGGRWNPPSWLPFYVYCASEGAEARTLLAELEAVAARVDVAFTPDDEAAELACRHIAARCGELAAACRERRLPEETYCRFWVEWSQAAFAEAQALFPAGMWRAWQALRPRARELAALGERG